MWPPSSAGFVRPGQRARRLRAGLHRPHQGSQESRHHPAGARDPRKPDASGRDGRGSAARRRRRHPDPAARRIPAPRVRQARHHASRGRTIRRRHGVPAARTGLAHGVRAGDRARDRRRRPGAARLARRARPTTAGCPMRTKEVEPVIRQVFVGRGGRDVDQDALERKLYIIRKRAGHAIQSLALRHGKEFYVPSMSTRTLVYKGMLLAQPGRHVLPRPRRRVDGVRAGDGAPALLDQHVPDVGPRASVPLHLPQRRDQHAARQLQLDPRPRRRDRVRRCWATTCRSCGR